MVFRFLSSGESHGRCLTAILEGIPSGFKLRHEDINLQLSKRQQGYGRGDRMKIEQDKVIITSGIRHGITTGAPITLTIENKDWENWQTAMSIHPVDTNNAEIQAIIAQKSISYVRPGHADLAGALKYNHKDIRNVLERSSARETAIRVAVGAVAASVLSEFNVDIFSHILSIGNVSADISTCSSYNIIKEFSEKSDLRCADYSAALGMKKIIDEAKESGDTLGGIFEVVALNVPVRDWVVMFTGIKDWMA